MKVPQGPPPFNELMSELTIDPDSLRRALTDTRPDDSQGRYLHWDDMRSRTPPDGLTLREWWFGTAMARRMAAKALPIRSVTGQPFRFTNVDFIQEMVHQIDQKASGEILAEDVVTNLTGSDRYLVSSLVEEAITSSQLEGASTTRRVAKEMLATGRKPRDRSEQMIANNYRGMLFAQEISKQALSPVDVLDLHQVLTEDALDNRDQAGRLQTPDQERVAVYWQNTIVHRPPPAQELQERLDAMCRFANGDSSSGFIHPVVRAIILHFCLAYDHPFVDGNGRTARALFYWAMLHKNYWLAQYLSISSILHRAPSQYARSYLLTETDDNDITYFVVYQLQVIDRAITSLHEYLARKIAETREIERLIQHSPAINHRQVLVIRDALRDAGEPFTINAQARRNRVTYETARTDLLKLEDLGLFKKQRVGKKFVFRPLPDLSDRLQKLGANASVTPSVGGR